MEDKINNDNVKALTRKDCGWLHKLSSSVLVVQSNSSFPFISTSYHPIHQYPLTALALALALAHASTIGMILFHPL